MDVTSFSLLDDDDVDMSKKRLVAVVVENTYLFFHFYIWVAFPLQTAAQSRTQGRKLYFYSASSRGANTYVATSCLLPNEVNDTQKSISGTGCDSKEETQYLQLLLSNKLLFYSKKKKTLRNTTTTTLTCCCSPMGSC